MAQGVSNSVKIAAAQFQGSIDREANLARAEALIHEAAARGVELICMHEMINTDYFCLHEVPDYRRKGEPIPGYTAHRLARTASRHGLFVVAGITEYSPDDNSLYNSAIAVDPHGDIVAHYRKLHRDGGEERYFVAGDLREPVFAGPRGIRCGILICYDRHFPEVTRRLTKAGAQLLLIPATTAFESWTYPIWEPELRAIASTNGAYVAAANRVGKDIGSASSLTYFGRSMIVTPEGQIAGIASTDREELVLCEADTSRVKARQHSEPWTVAPGAEELALIRPDDFNRSPDTPAWEEVKVCEPDGHLREVLPGVRMARLTGEQARKPEYWRALALNDVQLVATETSGEITDTFLAELQWLAVSSPCYVAVTAPKGYRMKVWIRPDGTLLRASSSFGYTEISATMFRSELMEARSHTGVTRHRRPDLLRALFASTQIRDNL